MDKFEKTAKYHLTQYNFYTYTSTHSTVEECLDDLRVSLEYRCKHTLVRARANALEWEKICQPGDAFECEKLFEIICLSGNLSSEAYEPEPDDD